MQNERGGNAQAALCPQQQKLVGVSLREKQTQRSEENAGPRSGRAPREDLKKELNQTVKPEAGWALWRSGSKDCLSGRGSYSDPEVSDSTTISLCPPSCDSEMGSLLGGQEQIFPKRREKSQVKDILGKVWVPILFCMRWTALAEMACFVLRLCKCFMRRYLARVF